MMRHLINWIEIPAWDIARAIRFYSTTLQIEFHQLEMGGNQYALFSVDDKFNTGALVQGDYYKPSAEGVLIYLDGGDDIAHVMSKVSAAGGKVIMEKTFLSNEAGYVGIFVDTEGNKIGLQHL